MEIHHRHHQLLSTCIHYNQLKNTQQDLKMYCSNHYVRKTSENLSWTITDHTYEIEAVAINVFKIRLKKIIFTSPDV